MCQPQNNLSSSPFKCSKIDHSISLCVSPHCPQMRWRDYKVNKILLEKINKWTQTITYELLKNKYHSQREWNIVTAYWSRSAYLRKVLEWDRWQAQNVFWWYHFIHAKLKSNILDRSVIINNWMAPSETMRIRTW